MEIKNIKDKILNLIYPDKIKCIFCGKEIFDDNVYETCLECKSKLPWIEKSCSRCGNELTKEDMSFVCNYCKGKELYYDRAKAVFRYEDEISLIIKKLKFKNGRYLALPLSNFLNDELSKIKENIDLIIPVPISLKKKKKRGFNQSELLCKELSKLSNIKTSFDILFKIKETKDQVKLNFNERQNNLKDCFVVKNKDQVKDKNIVLIDDVYTTGSTVMMCSKELKKAGAKKIFVLTLAHTVYKDNK